MTPQEKISALLSKTVANGATAAEEASAKAMAKKLADRHGLPLVVVAARSVRVEYTPAQKAAQEAARERLRQKNNAKDLFEEALRRAAAAEAASWARRAAKKAQDMPKGKSGTLGDFAIQLLLRRFNAPKGQPTGYTYQEVLDKIKQRFPTSKTTVSSLRWYENKLRKAHHDLPTRRPSKR